MFLVPTKIHRWLAVALEEAENTGTSGPEPTAYHILTMVFFFSHRLGVCGMYPFQL